MFDHVCTFSLSLSLPIMSFSPPSPCCFPSWIYSTKIFFFLFSSYFLFAVWRYINACWMMCSVLSLWLLVYYYSITSLLYELHCTLGNGISWDFGCHKFWKNNLYLLVIWCVHDYMLLFQWLSYIFYVSSHINVNRRLCVINPFYPYHSSTCLMWRWSFLILNVNVIFLPNLIMKIS